MCRLGADSLSWTTHVNTVVQCRIGRCLLDVREKDSMVIPSALLQADWPRLNTCNFWYKVEETCLRGLVLWLGLQTGFRVQTPVTSGLRSLAQHAAYAHTMPSPLTLHTLMPTYISPDAL